MSQAVDTSLVSLFGGVVVLLQVQLGVGLILGSVGSAVASNVEVRKRLEGTTWEATFRSVAKAVTPAPLLVAYGLLQMRGAAGGDGLSTVGLLVSAAALFFAALVAVLDTATDGKMERASRVLHAVRAFGQLLLVFGSFPAGAELWCASILLRAALVVRSAGSVGRALGYSFSYLTETSEDLEPVVALGPLVAGLALLDNMAWGPSGVMMLPLQAAPYSLLLLGFLAAVRFCGGFEKSSDRGRPAPRHSLDFKFDMDALEDPCSKLVALNILMIVISACRVAVGTFSISFSSTGLSVQWGELLVASAAKILFLSVAAHVSGIFFGKSGVEEVEEDHSHINGTDMSGSSATLSYGKDVGFPDYFKSITVPSEGLALAMLAVQIRSTDSFLKYGLLLGHVGVILQVLGLVLNTASTKAPKFDALGTVHWEGQGVVAAMQTVTNGCIQIGLFLGCLALGATSAALSFGVAAAGLFALSPAESRANAMEVVQLTAGSTLAGLESVLEQQRQAREAAAARRAAAVAQTLEAEAAKSAGKLAKTSSMGKKPSAAGAPNRKGK